ncbi:MAG: hypothetical protein ACTTJV_03420 [Ottowia sp.]
MNLLSLNPELQRNLWLQWSPARALLLPAVLALIAAFIVVSSNGEYTVRSALTNGFSFLAAVLVLPYGVYLSVGSIGWEIRERTWDQQRLSSLGPWQMAWGKLLGATSYAWYGALLCAAISLAASSRPAEHLGRLFYGLMLGLAMQACGMAMRLHVLGARLVSGQTGGQAGDDRNLDSSLSMSWLALLPLFHALLLDDAFFLKNAWWALDWPPLWQQCAQAALLLALGLLALWRNMSAQLMVATRPWAWPVGIAALALLPGGYVAADGLNAPCAYALALAVLALVTGYLDLFSQPQGRLAWQALFWHARSGQYSRLLQALPLWPINAALALLGSVAALMASDRSGASALAFALLVGALHLLRDAALVAFFAWREGARHPQNAAVIAMLIAGLLLPGIVGNAMGAHLSLWLEPAAGLLQPHPARALVLGSACLHLALMAALLAWRWRASGMGRSPDVV